MSEFYIRQNLLASNSRTIVKDEKDKPLYLLVGKWGVRGDVLSLYQMDGELVASVKQATFAFTIGARFDLYQGFEKVGSLQRILSFNRDFYYVHQLGWVVIGDIKNHTYAIYQLNNKVMEMKKYYLANGDYYALSVTNDKDAPLCICIASVLDYWLMNRAKDKNELKRRLPNLEFD